MGLYFGTDGIRGIANGQITPDLAFRCGNALAQAGAKKIMMGRDTRQSGDMLTTALTSGALSGGCDVVDVGVAPTPCIAYLAGLLGCFYGAVISASHNPPEFNGIKIFSSAGVKLSDVDEERIEKFMAAPMLASSLKTGRYSHTDEVKKYMSFLSGTAENLSGMKIVLDCANGATGITAPSVFKKAGAEVFAFNSSCDGKKINCGCGSLHPSFAAEKVKELNADAGFCFDGDGDRLIAADETGRIVDGDEIFCVLAKEFKRNGWLTNDCAVGTAHTNMGVEEELEKCGITLFRADIGDKYVNALMTAKGAELGGEQSGHIIIKRFLPTGDGVLSALQLAGVMKKSGKRLSQLANARLYPQCNLNVVVCDKMLVINHEELWQNVARLSEGLDGRILIRASGTEPKIRIMTECRDARQGEKTAKELADIIKKI